MPKESTNPFPSHNPVKNTEQSQTRGSSVRGCPDRGGIPSVSILHHRKETIGRGQNTDTTNLLLPPHPGGTLNPFTSSHPFRLSTCLPIQHTYTSLQHLDAYTAAERGIFDHSHLPLTESAQAPQPTFRLSQRQVDRSASPSRRVTGLRGSPEPQVPRLSQRVFPDPRCPYYTRLLHHHPQTAHPPIATYARNRESEFRKHLP